MDTNKLESITVPAAFADEVRRFAAFLASDRAASATVDSHPRGSTDDLPDYPLWPDELVIQLAQAGTRTARNYRRVMEEILANDMVGVWTSIDELTEWTGMKRSEVSTFRTHLYRYVHTHLATGTVAPFTGVWGTELRPSRGRSVFYRVSEECAAQWRRVQPTLEAAQ